MAIASVPVLLFSLLLAGIGVPSAGAVTGYFVTGASAGLRAHTGPHVADPVTGTLANGTALDIACQTTGDLVGSGLPGTPTNVWDQLANGWFITDYYTTTPGLGGFSPGIPQCGVQPPVDCEHFVADLSVPDGVTVPPSQQLDKGWRLRNCGTTDWHDLTAVRVSGDLGPASFPVPVTAPGATGDMYISLTAPSAPGRYRSTYQFTGPRGTLADSFWVEIVVGAPTADCEHFVADLTVPDGTVVAPGQTINKVWRLRNCGMSDWSGLQAIKVSGGFGPAGFSVPQTSPGATADIAVAMTVPTVPGHYRATYRLTGPRGNLTDTFWADIWVAKPAASGDCERFVADLSLLDGASVNPGAHLSKGWRLLNCGSTSWAGFSAVKISGSFGPASFAVPAVAPGTKGDLWASMTAPTTSGIWRATYQLAGPRGRVAGSFWVQVTVTQAGPAPNVYVSLGDSYSSGEGNPPFDADSASPTDTCHRSSQAYPYDLVQMGVAPTRLVTRACSGATIADVRNGRNGEASQLNSLNANTALVTVTIGGNDVNFGGFVEGCAVLTDCEFTYNTSVRAAIAVLNGQLSSLYKDIAARASRARIVVVGYPRFFAAQFDGVCPTITGVMLDVGERRWMNTMVDVLDAMIAQNVAAAGNSRIRYADTATTFATTGLCGGDNRAMNGITLDRDSHYSMHPTGFGHSLLAARIAPVIQAP